MKHLITSLLLALPCLLPAQIYTYPLIDSIPNEAHVYHLPKTGLDICITTRCVEEKPGELARYAERFLGRTDIIAEESLTQEIISIEVNTFTTADEDKCFYIITETPKVKNKLNKQDKNIPALATVCSNEGILLAVNAEASCPKAHKPAKEDKALHEADKQDEMFDIPSQAYMTQEMKLANSSLKMAELAARQIFSIRETRLALLHGELENIPQNSEAFRLYLNELNKMEQLYLELFVGSRKTSTKQSRVQYIPNGKPYDIVCRLSSQNGTVDKDDLSGRPIYCMVERNNDTNFIQATDSLRFPGKRKKETITVEEPAGLYYYLPQSATVSLLDGNQTIWQKELFLAQTGQLMRLKADKNISVVLDAKTGAIVKR